MSKRDEQALQIACVTWFDLQYAAQSNRLYQNYNNPPSARIGGILKAMGMRRGVADLSYLLPDGRTCFIELKTDKGKQSDTQKAFQSMVTELGNDYHIARTVYEFMSIINSYN